MTAKKTILVTGGGRGLARHLSEALARDGHRVVFTARDVAEGTRACAEIRAAVPTAQVTWHRLDLASFDDIRRFTTELPDTLRFDVLAHVAGVLQQSRTRRLSADGVEETLAVNALAPFLLTHELMPRLGTGLHLPRVMCVSSRLHMPNARGPSVAFNFEDPSLAHDYDPDRAYKNSKLALLWFTYELARRFPAPRLTAHAVCPGFVPATAAASTHGVMRLLMKHVMPWMPFATSVSEAVASLRFTAVDPALDQTTGDFWAEKKPFTSSAQSRALLDARRFWAYAERVTDVGMWRAAPVQHRRVFGHENSLSLA
jgi:NAD(P)-dependent dehydrogenase (short-subunit alcohol dehydrogenase family)